MEEYALVTACFVYYHYFTHNSYHKNYIGMLLSTITILILITHFKNEKKTNFVTLHPKIWTTIILYITDLVV